MSCTKNTLVNHHSVSDISYRVEFKLLFFSGLAPPASVCWKKKVKALTAASQDDDRMQQVTGKAAVGVTYKSVHNVYFCLTVWRQCDGSYTLCLLTRNISTITTF